MLTFLNMIYNEFKKKLTVRFEYKFDFSQDFIINSISYKANFLLLQYKIYFSIRHSRHTMPPKFCHVT